MKISQKQASLLAQEIVRQLKAKKVDKISPELKQRLIKFCEERDAMNEQKEKMQELIYKHENSIKKIIGNNVRVYGSDTLSRMIEQIEAKNIPSVSSIEDEIILKSMFKSDDDMETFVNSIVKKYEKRLQAKVLSN